MGKQVVAQVGKGDGGQGVEQEHGPARIAQQVPADRLAELRTEWAEEGYFGG